MGHQRPFDAGCRIERALRFREAQSAVALIRKRERVGALRERVGS